MTDAADRSHAPATRSPVARAMAPVGVLLIGALVTGAGWLVDHRRTDQQLVSRSENAADRFTAAIGDELDRYADAARAMRAVFEHHERPDPAVYARATEALELTTRYPAITGLNAVLPGGPAMAGPWTISYVEPRGRNRTALGFDIRENAPAAEAAQRAAQTGQPAMTPPITLAQEPGDALGFVVYVPMYDPAAPLGSAEQRRDAFRGWTQAVFRGPDLVRAVASDAPPLWVEVTSSSGSSDVVVTTVGDEPIGPSMQREVIRFGQRWTLDLRPTAASLAVRPPGYGGQIVGLGTLVTLLLAALVLALVRSDRRAQQLVEVRTDELEHARARAEATAAQARDRAAQLGALNDRLETANEQLTRAIAERDELTAVVAHDVRSPLTVIRGFAETIETLDGATLSGASRDFLARIQRHARELEALVDDLVLGSRLGAAAVRAQPSTVDLGQLAAELTADVLRGSQAEVRIAPDRPVLARVDERHARRVLSNLLSNARKHGAPPIEVEVGHQDDRVVISVTDHGRGVPAGVADQLFERFAGGDPSAVGPGSGAGLGLSIVADLVRLNGGTVHHEPVEPNGARFTVTFPAARVGEHATIESPPT